MTRMVTHDGEEIDYVSVHEEPMHKHQFDNEYVWCYRVGLEPGKMCKWHRHSEDSFYVALTDGKALNRPCDRPEYVHPIKKFDQWWSMAKTNPIIHQVCLLAECPIAADFFALEILKSPPVTSDAPLNCPGYTVDSEYSKDKARVYQLSLEPGQSTGMHKLNFYGVVLSLSDGELSSEGDGSPFADGKLSKYGRFKWVEGPIEFSVKNEGEAVYKALVVEWLRHE
eukprot:TRINITY_DN907_c0_g1_i2.p1 TRINITY_DN907_c0_g1~~TRINITY_DN907_c0_g1_i2.p1  ORF type:complete len:240 (-),score=62.25 TRINITY_DN907_c0_g1_i2:394-1068(-)